MANNRIYLWCPECKEASMLAKCLGDGYYLVVDDPLIMYKEIGERFVTFLDDHLQCRFERGEATAVELRFESHPDASRELP